MKIQIVTLCRTLPMIVPLILTVGCATPALWKQTAAREWKPNPPDQVILVTNTNQHREVVVIFRQLATHGKSIESRDVALPVSRPNGEMAISNEVVRELTNSACECRRIPVYFADQEPINTSPLSSGYATWDSMEQQLTIHAPDTPTGPFKLPTSHQKQKTAARLCGLPFAVAGDAVIVGTVLFLVGISGYRGP